MYTQFVAEASDTVRKLRVDRQWTLDALLYAMAQPPKGKGDPPSVRCEDCSFVGACTAELCQQEPERIVRVCVPRSTTKAQECISVLCFDAAELSAYVAPDAVGPMPNPAVTLGVNSGVPVAPADLVSTLDANATATLRWQLALWRDFGSLQRRVTLDPAEYGFLRSVVLPAFAKGVQRLGDSRIGRWFRRMNGEQQIKHPVPCIRPPIGCGDGCAFRGTFCSIC